MRDVVPGGCAHGARGGDFDAGLQRGRVHLLDGAYRFVPPQNLRVELHLR